MSLQKLFRAICVLPECCLAAEAGSVRMTADRWFRRPAPDLYLIGSLGTQPHLSVRKWTVFGSYSIFPKSFHNSLPTHSNGVRRFARIWVLSLACHWEAPVVCVSGSKSLWGVLNGA